MTAYDDWLEQPFQEAEARLEAIEARTDELTEIGGEWDAQDYHVFTNALADDCLKNYEQEIKNILATGNGYALLGEVVWSAVTEYCNAQAEEQATTEIDEGIKS